MNSENWYNTTSEVFSKTLVSELNDKIYSSIFIESTEVEFAEFISNLIKKAQKRVVLITHPFFPKPSLVEKINIEAFYTFFDNMKTPLLNLKLPCKDFGSPNEIEHYNYKDLTDLKDRILVFFNIDLFDYKTQYLLSKMKEYSESENIILMQFDGSDSKDHIDKEAVINSQRVKLVNK
jgi:hypothetical protein